jgi:ribosome maturation factor RimP
VEDRRRRIEELVGPVVALQGVDLVEVALGGGRRRAVVRVVVHSEAGVTHADCVRVTRAVGRALEDAAEVPGSYLLEVSSPGLDRVLKRPREFDLFRGRRVAVRLVDAPAEVTGRASGSRGEAVALACDDGGEEVLPWSRVASARLLPGANEPGSRRTGR